MNSADIPGILNVPTPKWMRLERSTVDRPFDHLGVYVIRIASGKPVGRLKGQSDVIYIGSGQIETRVKAHSRPRFNFKDKGSLLAWIAADVSIGELEVAFFPCQKHKEVESDLLFGYLQDHREPPPANLKLELNEKQKVALCLSVETKRDVTTEQIDGLLRELDDLSRSRNPS
ncbi:MAG: hypothetical protein WBQ43_01420 [Terriglobales bacterium]